jgi:hypothetical protein
MGNVLEKICREDENASGINSFSLENLYGL